MFKTKREKLAYAKGIRKGMVGNKKSSCSKNNSTYNSKSKYDRDYNQGVSDFLDRKYDYDKFKYKGYADGYDACCHVNRKLNLRKLSKKVMDKAYYNANRITNLE